MNSSATLYALEKEINLLPLPGIKPKFLRYPAHNLVTTGLNTSGSSLHRVTKLSHFTVTVPSKSQSYIQPNSDIVPLFDHCNL